MTKEIIPQPLNSVWAVDTPNKLNINDDETNQGVLYQSLVVSNQMNGALYKMSQALRAQQLSGGYYTYGQRYFKGQIVKASVIEDVRYRPTVRFYECIDDDGGQGLVDTPLYNQVQATVDLGGVRTYTVDPGQLNTTNWKQLDGSEQQLREFVLERMKELTDYVNSEIARLDRELRGWVTQRLTDQQKQFDKQIADQRTWVNQQISRIEDRWKDLGVINGGTLNLDLGGANNDFNCFRVQLNGSVTFGTCRFQGARERSGCFLIAAGAQNVANATFFTNVYKSFQPKPWFPLPQNSNNGQLIWLFYKCHPTYGVCFTRG